MWDLGYLLVVWFLISKLNFLRFSFFLREMKSNVFYK